MLFTSVYSEYPMRTLIKDNKTKGESYYKVHPREEHLPKYFDKSVENFEWEELPREQEFRAFFVRIRRFRKGKKKGYLLAKKLKRVSWTTSLDTSYFDPFSLIKVTCTHVRD